MFKSGFVALVGKPNVGKSSLLNAFVGEKVSITGPKPQTTRNRILGIKNDEDFQMVFVDTPGIHKPHSKLGEFMQKSIKEGMDGVDAYVVVLDGTKIDERDSNIIANLEKVSVPVFVAMNKMDVFTFEKVYPELKRLGALKFVKDIVNVSAKTGENVDVLEKKLLEVLPEGIRFFDSDSITDRSERFLVSEIVREKALLYLQNEIPHGIAIEIPKFEEVSETKANIDVDIICEKQRHKQIVIGKNGEMLKKIATSSRGEIEKLLGRHVYLNCFVKVEENWRNDVVQLKNAGYDIKNT